MERKITMKHVKCCTTVKKAPAKALLQFVDAIKDIKPDFYGWNNE